MWTNSYWANYWADVYWPPVGQDGEPAPEGTEPLQFIIGLGPMGKARVHPHPNFNRVQQ